MPKVRLTPEEKLLVESGVNAGKKAVDILKDIYTKTRRPEIRKAIHDEIAILNTDPTELVEKIRQTPVETKTVGEEISYRIRRMPQIVKSEIRELGKEFQEARHASLTQSWKFILPALQALNIIATPVTAPAKAFIGEPLAEKVRGKVPSWMARLIEEAPGMVATIGAGAALKAAKVPQLLGIGKKAAEVVKPSYELHQTLTKEPLAKELWESIVNKVETLKALHPEQRKLWRKEFAEKVKRFYEEYDLALSRGDFEAAIRASKALEGDLQAILARNPEFVKQIPIFTKEELEGLVKTIHGAPKTMWQKKELTDALAEVMIKGRVPQKKHLKELNEILGFDVSVLGKRGFWANLVAFPRAIMASTDLSGIFRQGVLAVGRPQFWKAIPTYIKSFGKKNYETVMESIITDAYFGKAKKAGLALTDLLTGPEEYFISKLRPWGIGRIIEASERGYQGFLNKLRYDLFKDMGTKLEALGHNIEDNPDLFRKLAIYINSLTGRGELPGKIGQAMARADIFFAPRLIASRLYFLDPTRYLKLPKELRLEYLRDMFSFLGFGSGILALAALNGAKIETDPRSADFMKARFENTRIDPWGGFLPYIVLASRLASGGMVSSTSGKFIEVGEGIDKIGYTDLLYRWLEGKFAPVPSFLWHWTKGTDFTGQPFDIVKETLQMLIPISIQDVWDAIDTQPSSLWYVIPTTTLGLGVQTYMPNSYYQNVDIPDDVRKRVNNGLFEVKLGLPIPKTINGFPLKEREKELLKNEYGKEVYNQLDKLFSSQAYQSMPLPAKERIVKSIISNAKIVVVAKHFPHLPQFKYLWQKYQYAYGWDERKAKKYAEEVIRKIDRQLRGELE